MAALLCETVTGETMGELLAARDAAGVADMVELRLDGVRDLDVERALYGRRGPVIATCRPAWEGGRFDGREDQRRALLARALAAGAEYVDVEWKAVGGPQGTASFDDLFQANRSRIVLSSHDFTGVPGDLCSRVGAMRAAGAAVIKVAVSAARLSDTLPLLDIARAGDAVVIGMGAARMVEEFRFRSITGQTAVYGIAGREALTSGIPAARNAAFAAGGVDAVCVPLPVADAADIDAFAGALGIIGWERCT
jgi:3-dehydroquinate dehydratase-1/3-dehydroquinate dehydratase/shikimate dehydrogenase